MFKKSALAAALLAPGLLLLGALLDARPALPQSALWLGLHAASLSGASLGLAACAALHAPALGARGRLAFALLALCAWRVGYFPIMVFSGHAASLCEWLALALGLPVFVYPAFLLSVFLLHILWAALMAHSFTPAFFLRAQAPPRAQNDAAELRPRVSPRAREGGESPAPPGASPQRAASSRVRWRWLSAPAFALAACVSFNQPRDLLPLPDTAFALAAPAANTPVFEQPNPYRRALLAPGYWPHQRVVLLAAALTFETIPPSPWATAVKLTLVDLFNAKPHGATRDRVREHYRAYHNAQRFLGCRALEKCARALPNARCARRPQMKCARAPQNPGAR